jgi:hypothetical protein
LFFVSNHSIIVPLICSNAACEDDAEDEEWNDFRQREEGGLEGQIVPRAVFRVRLPPEVVTEPNPKEAQDEADLNKYRDARDLAAHLAPEGCVVTHLHEQQQRVPHVVIR